MATPIHRLSYQERAAVVEELAGKVVVVTYSGQRDAAAASQAVGQVIGFAGALTGGTGAGELVLRLHSGTVGGGRRLATLSMATVISIEAR